MTIKQARFLSDNFRAYCLKYEHIPVFFPVYEKGKSTEIIRKNPYLFSNLLNAFIMQIIETCRKDPDYNARFETLQELQHLTNHPDEIKYYGRDRGWAYDTVAEYVQAIIK